MQHIRQAGGNRACAVKGGGDAQGLPWGATNAVLNVGRERQLLAVEAVRAVVREEEADGVEVAALLDLRLVELDRYGYIGSEADR